MSNAQANYDLDQIHAAEAPEMEAYTYCHTCHQECGLMSVDDELGGGTFDGCDLCGSDDWQELERCTECGEENVPAGEHSACRYLGEPW